MQQRKTSLFRALHAIIFYIICLTIICITETSCEKFFSSNKTVKRPKEKNFSWNILFELGTNSEQRLAYIESVKDYIQQNYHGNAISNASVDTVKIDVVFCPCDTLLYNLNFTAIGLSGGSQSTTAGNTRDVKGSGDVINALIADNEPIIIDTNKEAMPPARKSAIYDFEIDTTKILAILDSGIDTAYFDPAFKKLFWSHKIKNDTFNFLPGRPLNDFSDKFKEKHGTAVASAAITAITSGEIRKYPKIMILKIADPDQTGSVFSVSCGLSYAIKHNATIINLSLGYYGESDPVLYNYLELCAKAQPAIQVFAAAGNTPHPHSAPVCTIASSNNQLGNNRMFYPACFSYFFNNLTTVTQLNSLSDPCIYQNYSGRYVTLGILDANNCCSVPVEFMFPGNKDYYEGSSFVTPIASGLKMSTIFQTGNTGISNAAWTSLIKYNTLNHLTRQGQYITYSPHF